MFLVPVPPYENPTVAPGNIWTFYRQSWINPDFTALSPHESDQPGSVKVFLLWIRCFSFPVFGTDIILTVVNIPIKLSPVLNSSPWSSNCSHRPKNIDPFPLPPTLTVSPTACGPEPGRCCPVNHPYKHGLTVWRQEKRRISGLLTQSGSVRV